MAIAVGWEHVYSSDDSHPMNSSDFLLFP